MRHIYPLLKKSGNGYWYIWWNRTVRESLKTKEKQLAERIFAQKRRESRDAKLVALTPANEKTLSQFVTEYTEWRAKDKKSDATVDMDSLALRLLAEFVGGDKQMSKISDKSIDDFHAWLMTPREITTPTGSRKLKKGCESTSVNVYIRHLKVAFKRAARWGYLVRNPYAEVKQYKVDEVEAAFLTREDIQHLLSMIEEEDFRIMVQFYLYTGGRGREISLLKREHIRSIGEDKSLWVCLSGTKVHRPRWIPLQKPLIPLLDKLPKKGFLFPRWRNVETVSKKLKRYLRRAGLGHMWLHGLRHTNISHLTMAGLTDSELMALSGHTQKSTLKIYQHLSPDHLSRVADVLDFEEGRASSNKGKVRLINLKKRKHN